MHDSSPNSRHQTSNIRECKCTNCGAERLTLSGTKCACGGSYQNAGSGGMIRKAYGEEDTDFRKGGLR